MSAAAPPSLGGQVISSWNFPAQSAYVAIALPDILLARSSILSIGVSFLQGIKGRFACEHGVIPFISSSQVLSFFFLGMARHFARNLDRVV
jgi:hypothetical protein